MPYVPSRPPTNPDDFPEYFVREYRKIHLALQNPEQEVNTFAILSVAPDKPRDGMVVYADGVNWNPGVGANFYWYSLAEARWIPMGGYDFFLEVAKGNVTGHTAVNRIGHDSTITTTLATVGNNLGQLQTYSTTADIDSISSDNAGDTHVLTVVGLDASYNEVVQTVTLNGQNRVALTTPLFRVQKVYNASATATAGVIWVYVNTAIVAGKPTDLTKIRSSIHKVPTGAGTVSNEVSTDSVYTVPAGKTAYIVFGKTTVTDAKAMELTFWGKQEGGVFQSLHHIDVKDNNYDYFFKLPGAVPEKTDLEVRATVNTGTAEVSVAYDIVLVDN